MIFYLLPILLGLLLSWFELKFSKNQPTNINKFIKRIYLFVTAVILCGGYMTGSDWRAYELLYNNASIQNIDTYFQEKGFYLLMIVFKNIGFSFFPFMIFLKFIVFHFVSTFLNSD